MRKPDIKTLQAMTALRNNPDFDLFLAWLDNSYLDFVKALVMVFKDSDIEHRIQQGRTMAVKQIMDTIRTSEDELRKVTSKPS